MKRIVIIFSLLIATLSLYAQELTVKRMEVAPMDLSASTQPRNDKNGNACALVKVQLATPGASFEGNVIGDAEFKEGEYWVYMSEGSYMLNIKHKSFVPLFVNFRDYNIKKVEGKTTYLLTLLLPQAGNVIVDDGMRYLVLEVVPGNATVLVDGKQREVKNGTAKVRLPQGEHSYSVSAVGYASKQGTVVVGNEKKQIAVTLESAIATLNVICATDGADIYVNDELRGRTPWNGTLLGGDYLVEARKEGYRPTQKSISLKDSESQTVNLPALQMIYGTIDVNYDPVGTEVWLDGRKLGTSPDIFRNVAVGTHQLRLVSTGYQDKLLQVSVEESKTQTVSGALQKATVADNSETAGMTDAQIVDLALSYYWGANGKSQNRVKSFNLLKVAAEHGYADAEYNLGVFYYFGHGVQADKSQALAYWEKAAEKGDARAIGNLGALYANGNVNGKRDYKRALYYYNKAIEAGNAPESYTSLSYYYEYGIEVEKDIKKAEALLKKGASIGSYYCSGRCLYDGIGRKRDYRQAFLQFRKSVDENDSDGGRYYLGECYANGYGTTQDVVKAVQLYARAAEREHMPAMKRLAECYETGTGVQKDLARAKYWYQKAADEGSDEARAKLDELGVSTPSSGAAVETFTVNGVSFNMVRVEGGSFMMGDEEKEGKVSYNKPAHQVTLSAYSIGETEVTQALWTAVMGDNPSITKGDDLPVDGISWQECMDFISKLNASSGMTFRLPTEAEWEYAARGAKYSLGYKYAGSNDLDEVAWVEGNSNGHIHPVKTKRPNELGLYDMSGNVFELCQDYYGKYSKKKQTNPMNTDKGIGYGHVMRGGSWEYDFFAQVYYRSYFQYEERGHSGTGLRLAL